MNSGRQAYNDFEWTQPSCLAAMTHSEVPWRYYLQTVVHFDIPACRGLVRPVDAGTGADDPPLGALHVLTAVQPGASADSAESAARIDVLDHELRDRGLRTLPAVGASFDGTYREESRAVFGLDDEQARELGRRFGQVAVFRWRDSSWSLIACAGERETHRGWLWNPRS